MTQPRLLPAALAAVLLATPVLAQGTGGAAPDTAAPAGATPEVSGGGATLPGVVATTNNPNLAVATVKLERGIRTSKLIGSAVYGDANQQVGTLDDLVMTEGNKVTVAVVSVGGFLGMGAKLVAFPYEQLKWDGQHLTLPGATKDSLNAMPNFEY